MAKSKGCGNRVKGQVSDIIKNSKVKDDGARSDLIEYLNEREIFALTAYLALIPQSGDMEKLRVDVYSFSRNVMPFSKSASFKEDKGMVFTARCALFP